MNNCKDFSKFIWNNKIYLLGSGAALSILASTAPALTQTETDTGPRLEEIAVTAQKRSEPLQRTALAISAVSAETLETRGIESAGKLTGIAPNLTTSAGSGSSSWACWTAASH